MSEVYERVRHEAAGPTSAPTPKSRPRPTRSSSSTSGSSTSRTFATPPPSRGRTKRRCPSSGRRRSPPPLPPLPKAPAMKRPQRNRGSRLPAHHRPHGLRPRSPRGRLPHVREAPQRDGDLIQDEDEEDGLHAKVGQGGAHVDSELRAGQPVFPSRAAGLPQPQRGRRISSSASFFVDGAPRRAEEETADAPPARSFAARAAPAAQVLERRDRKLIAPRAVQRMVNDPGEFRSTEGTPASSIGQA